MHAVARLSNGIDDRHQLLRLGAAHGTMGYQLDRLGTGGLTRSATPQPNLICGLPFLRPTVARATRAFA
jgi:hypothetical protein